MPHNISGILTGIGFSDIVDIAIISFVVYKLIVYVRSSRAMQLFKGLLFIVAATLISDICDFYTVHWILSKVLEVGLIALIVVFQPELRRALELIGRNGFGVNKFSMNRELITDSVDTIVRAVDYFSQRKEGALIVIERETALSDIAETGTILNARLSESMLENIFYKGSPLHDGAAILRENTIFAAGCVLPLTQNSNLPKDLGTRHRAGIGISEVSDALVIIVSEETGIISIASDGKLSRFLDLKTVEKTLLGYYLSKLNEKTSLVTLPEFIRKKKDETQKNS